MIFKRQQNIPVPLYSLCVANGSSYATNRPGQNKL